jgi:hypothetical protein
MVNDYDKFISKKKLFGDAIEAGEFKPNKGNVVLHCGLKLLKD